MSKCPNCNHEFFEIHYNPATMLPPVGPHFIILKDNNEIKVKRDTYVSRSDNKLEYRTNSGDLIIGRFSWRHI